MRRTIRVDSSSEDARYMLRWLDRLVAIAESQPQRFPDVETRDKVLKDYAEARRHYEKVILQARDSVSSGNVSRPDVPSGFSQVRSENGSSLGHYGSIRRHRAIRQLLRTGEPEKKLVDKRGEDSL